MYGRKYTKELLEPIVARSSTIADVLKALNLKLAGGTHTHITKTIDAYGIDRSHFKGRGSSKGRIANNKLLPEEVLIIRNNNRRQDVKRLRRSLLSIGREYKCELCNNKGVYNNRKLILEIDHINSNWLDDRAENLRFLCPNCHYQETYNAPMVESGETQLP